ncbi:unnamed protein product [Caenorhabditis brenneri]
MSLYPFFDPRSMTLARDAMRGMDGQYMPLSMVSNDQSSANSEIVNTEEKFAINLNVSQFKPEELKINLEGRRLSIQGEQDVSNEHGHSTRSFSRVILLPEDVDVASVASNLSDTGRLSIEAPKLLPAQGRPIPIQQAAIEQNPM